MRPSNPSGGSWGLPKTTPAAQYLGAASVPICPRWTKGLGPLPLAWFPLGDSGWRGDRALGHVRPENTSQEEPWRARTKQEAVLGCLPRQLGALGLQLEWPSLSLPSSLGQTLLAPGSGTQPRKGHPGPAPPHRARIALMATMWGTSATTLFIQSAHGYLQAWHRHG